MKIKTPDFLHPDRQEIDDKIESIKSFKVVTNEDVINQMYGQENGTFGVPEIAVPTGSEVKGK